MRTLWQDLRFGANVAEEARLHIDRRDHVGARRRGRIDRAPL